MTAIQAPDTHPRHKPICGRCSRCHPGRQWGGDENCRKAKCLCHRWEKP